jgi:putative PIN family toxin of toxin-antitoxin system
VRATLDTNVIVSAANGFSPPETPLAGILRAGLRRRYTIVTSDHILGEVRFALSKPFFASRLTPGMAETLLADLEQYAEKVEITNPVKGIATHWQDDLVLATALSGNADILVTGDRELLELNHPYRFRIISPQAFLLTLDGSEAVE